MVSDVTRLFGIEREFNMTQGFFQWIAAYIPGA